MEDITLLFITGNRVPEKWGAFQRKTMLEAGKGSPVITISRQPMPFMPGINLLDDKPSGPLNFYSQILRGAKTATTPYVALCEDDTLYTEDHFKFRPPLDTFAYNVNRWSIYTWGVPTYSFRKGSRCGCAGIYPRQLAVDSLEERFERYGDHIPIKIFGELGCYEKYMDVTIRKTINFYSDPPIIQMAHHYFSLHENTPEARVHIERKRMGFVRAFEVPYWGKAEDIVRYFHD